MEINLGKYEHYKRKHYEVLDVAKHSEIMEYLVVYKALYGEGKLWVRPPKCFFKKLNSTVKKLRDLNTSVNNIGE
ncbi:MAG: hypothetical protein A3G45_02685 [Candidatus Staskawiczbacteria bacterium RIFCSPLOWO2_12_FULL_37_15]|uniref:DUF1653 domain-containing protein n=1 Tax=Candidatus Staskawiczbacteria bacterium RIFCSPLOWO2_12_FULL_37_15 TaxID=1802218 RepID=A0A1G2IQH6_9BACT|nr:MAG: hypothetical protein US35_C0001G0030 [Parcubacteria group bacterium GW2011_GWA2_37_10]OGZ76963.1 MAG: hypothetical protein A3G45_02685 [Candidatus Staskawiczbacteria bacterium RIFCSPLOWO2_12_FULL_37_15]